MTTALSRFFGDEEGPPFMLGLDPRIWPVDIAQTHEHHGHEFRVKALLIQQLLHGLQDGTQRLTQSGEGAE